MSPPPSRVGAATAAGDRQSWDLTWLHIALVFGLDRSACDRRKVGAVVVDRRNQVCATTYNGPPAGQDVDLARGCLAWCPRAQHLRQMSGDVLADLEADDVLSYRSCPSLHAEANALLQADRTRIEGGTIYVSSAVCHDCAKLIANSGLARVVMLVQQGDEHRQPDQVIRYLRSCGLEVLVGPNGGDA